MLSKFMQFAEGVLNDLESKARKFAGAKSKDRVAAVTAMVAYIPDEDADKDEIKKGVQAIVKHSGGVYTIDEMLTAINKHVATLEFDTNMGEAELMTLIGPTANTEEATFLIHVAIAVGKASGEPGEDPFSDAEKDVVRRIISRLGEAPGTYGL